MRNNIGTLTVTLSQGSFPGGGDVYVRLNTDPSVQQTFIFATNVVKIFASSTNSEPQEFTIRDGTVASHAFGVTLIPEIINNANAAAFFTDLRTSSVFVRNIDPQVTRPEVGMLVLPSLPPFDKVPMATPSVFDYTVTSGASPTTWGTSIRTASPTHSPCAITCRPSRAGKPTGRPSWWT